MRNTTISCLPHVVICQTPKTCHIGRVLGVWVEEEVRVGRQYGKGDPVLWLASGGSRVSRLSPWGGCPCKNEGRGGHICKNVVSCARTSPLGGRACRDESRGGWGSRQ